MWKQYYSNGISNPLYPPLASGPRFQTPDERVSYLDFVKVLRSDIGSPKKVGWDEE